MREIFILKAKSSCNWLMNFFIKPTLYETEDGFLSA